ncbi:ABC transporter C-terminal domain-containing protein, partial [Acidisphaera rubrifaciens]|uniref:ABC transporter C-terminal domain-containing protein n=1 Tax=Acidisphaera rubrifaciens TaxID=50715 RepID=UPI001F5293AF
GRAAASRPVAPRPAPVRPTTAERPRLSFKERHRLQQLPDRIAALESDIAKLSRALETGDLYTRDPAAFTDTTRRLADAQAALAAAEDEWLTLEMRRAEAEG